MATPTLCDCHILIVEDEYLLADDLARFLEQEGAIVVGPASCIDSALSLIASEQRIDIALLDVNLGGSAAFSVADVLIERGVPFAFTTGYDGRALPSRFGAVPRLEKPFRVALVASFLKPLL